MPEPLCKPSSVPRNGRGDEHSSRTRVAARLQRAVPGGSGRADLRPAALARPGHALAGDASLFALAPGVVCRAAPVTRRAVRSYRTVSPLPRSGEVSERRQAPLTVHTVAFGGLFSVALSCGSPRPAVSRHPAL